MLCVLEGGQAKYEEGSRSAVGGSERLPRGASKGGEAQVRQGREHSHRKREELHVGRFPNCASPKLKPPTATVERMESVNFSSLFLYRFGLVRIDGTTVALTKISSAYKLLRISQHPMMFVASVFHLNLSRETMIRVKISSSVNAEMALRLAYIDMPSSHGCGRT